MNRKCVAVNSCILSNLVIVLGNLLWNFLPTFALVFLKSVVLQNWVWRSDFWLVQWLHTSLLYFIFSMFDFTQHTTSLLYRQDKGSISRSLKRFLQEACWPTLPIILKTFFSICGCSWENNTFTGTVWKYSSETTLVCITYVHTLVPVQVYGIRHSFTGQSLLYSMSNPAHRHNCRLLIQLDYSAEITNHFVEINENM